VEPSRVEKTEGESVDIMCRFGKSIERCKFIGPNSLVYKLSEKFPERDDFRYIGQGLESGQCGLRILSLDRKHEGNWTCELDLGDGSDDILGFAEVIIARAPQQPQLHVDDQNNLRESGDLYAECAFRDGRPNANVRWFIGNEEFNSHREEMTEQNGYEIVTSRFQSVLKADQNLMNLVCRIEHPAFAEGFTNTSHQLQVNYPPQALSRQELYIGSLTIGSSADLAITIRSNPKPRLQWTVDGTILREGTQNERFVVHSAEQTDGGRWLAKLTVIQLTLEDTTKTFTLRADNQYGAQDYPIRIGGSPDENGNLS
jgi:CD80-like C2-set immunoglobulin domain